jgi:hypothetical protein
MSQLGTLTARSLCPTVRPFPRLGGGRGGAVPGRFTLVSEDVKKLPPGYINVEDAAVFLRLSDESVRRFIGHGTLDAEKQHQVHGPVGWILPTAGSTG